jgi:two-component system sensor histidine kinase UhpB
MKLNQYLGRRIAALALVLLSIFLTVAITQATISIQREKKGTEQLLLLSQELDYLRQAGLSDFTPQLNKLIALSQSDEFRHIRIYFKDAKGQIIAQSNPDRNISVTGNLLNNLFALTHQSPTDDVVSASWVIRGPDRTITVYISPDPASELNEAANALLSSMLMLIALTTALYFGVKLTLGKALAPLKQSLNQLQDLAHNKYDGVLKESDISEVKAVNDAINELSQSLIDLENSRQMLSAKLISSQEDERARISRDIHDELGQKIAVIRYNTTYLQKTLKSKANLDMFNDALQAIGDISEATKNIDCELKKILKELRPQQHLLTLNNESIKKLLIDLIDGWQTTTATACKFNYSIDLGAKDIQQNIGLTLFRITQEALTNIAKHAHASVVDIQIHVDQTYIYWAICDNGVGIPNWDASTQQRGNGLSGLQERLWAIGGELVITPKLEEGGFGLTAKIPLGTSL